MKTMNKTFFILAMLLGIFYSQKGIAIDCNTPDPGCECTSWRTNSDFGQYIEVEVRNGRVHIVGICMPELSQVERFL